MPTPFASLRIPPVLLCKAAARCLPPFPSLRIEARRLRTVTSLLGESAQRSTGGGLPACAFWIGGAISDDRISNDSGDEAGIVERSLTHKAAGPRADGVANVPCQSK